MAQASEHRGNITPFLELEEHDGNLNAKRVSLASAATIYAVTAGGTQTVTPVGLTTLGASPNYIGLTTTVLGAGIAGIGFSTVQQGGNWDVAVVRGNVTVEQGDDPW